MSAGVRARRSPRGFDSRLTGLRALAILVNDALASMGTPSMGTAPAFAVSGGSLPGPFGPQIARSALESPPSPRPSGSVRGGVGTSPSPRADPQETHEVDETHVETWRLVGLAQQGDGEAFGQLYDRYCDTVYRFIYYRVNDRALAEDFTSETFLRALRRIGSISYQGRDIGAWFITIARNIVLDHLKSARPRLGTTTARTIEGKDYAQSTEAAVLETLQSERLMQAVNQLGDEQRECVMLRFVQGMSVSETAQIMGKNDGAIKALQHRAVRKLADLVGNELR